MFQRPQVMILRPQGSGCVPLEPRIHHHHLIFEDIYPCMYAHAWEERGDFRGSYIQTLLSNTTSTKLIINFYKTKKLYQANTDFVIFVQSCILFHYQII